MIKKLVLALGLIAAQVKAQPYFPAKVRVFNDSLVPRIDITIDPP